MKDAELKRIDRAVLGCSRREEGRRAGGREQEATQPPVSRDQQVPTPERVGGGAEEAGGRGRAGPKDSPASQPPGRPRETIQNQLAATSE